MKRITVPAVINTHALTDAPRIPADTVDKTEVVDAFSEI